MMPEDKGRRRGNREQRFGDALFGGIQCDTHGSAFYHVLRVSSGTDTVFPCSAASSY